MSHDCPTCDRTLTTESGMRQHHTKVHGNPLPNRSYKGCGTGFYDPKARRSFCEDCDSNAGEHNGNYRGTREQTECRRCDESFEFYPSNKEGVYCPECVETTDEFLGTASYELREVERVERECEHCGSVSTYLQSDVDRGRGRFCDRSCHAAWMAENRRGPDHHAWRGNDTDGWYKGQWWQVRRRARERDGHACQLCERTRDDIGREPDVHHIRPIRTFEDPTDAHTLDNVICLCRRCHARAEAEGRRGTEE